MPTPTVGDALCQSALALSKRVSKLRFADPVHTVYNPLDYAWAVHERYLRLAGRSTCRVILIGMNPGPWGMAQTGVPFGEIAAARDWLGLEGDVSKPKTEHPKRPVEGFACARSEVSGRRLWGLFAERFNSPDAFFAEHFIVNYCPLVFMADTGRNLTPDKLPAAEREPLEAACDEHLAAVINTLDPEWVVGVGAFAEKRATAVLSDRDMRITRILHPSPASPTANKDWAGTATRQLIDASVW